MYSIDNPVTYDLEVFPNYIMAGFYDPALGVVQYVDDGNNDCRAEIQQILEWVRVNNKTLMGFNSLGYDDPVLTAYLRTGDPNAAFETSVRIIRDKEPYWNFDNQINSVDLMPVIPGKLSLKKSGVCLGHKVLQELPVDYDKHPSDHEKEQVLPGYNINDLIITYKLYVEIKGELDLRVKLSNDYGIDLRSKGRAATAESILLSELGKRNKPNKKKALNRRSVEIIGDRVQVFKPSWWDTLVTNNLLIVEGLGERIFRTPILLDYNGRMTKGSFDYKVFIDDRYYQMGVGGIHSVDGPGAWIPADDEVMFDIDVSSMYPMIILTQGLYPRAWGPVFLEIYKELVEQRLAAKDAEETLIADVLKIVVNGTYGKSSDVHSALLDPQLTANTTLNGQLALLALVEMLQGVATVCSTNTDGMTVLVKKKSVDLVKYIVKDWEIATRLKMDYVGYQAIYQRDVNNYIAIKSNGKPKQKGFYIDKWPDLEHTPSGNIIATAVTNFLAEGVPVEQTVKSCNDLNQFLLTQNVTGQTTTSWNGQALGKVLRFYKSQSPQAAPIIRRSADGKAGTVPDSDDCIPVENLPDGIPPDLNLTWYINKANINLTAITRPKVAGMNRWAEEMCKRGLPASLVDTSKERFSKAAAKYGQVDFTSLPENHTMGVKTGGDLIARWYPEEGRAEFYRTTKGYPAKTRALIKRDYGWELLYGYKVPHTGLIHINPEVDWDEFYTPAELRRVGR